MKILVCGGAGYVGSHAVAELLEIGHGAFAFWALMCYNLWQKSFVRRLALTGAAKFYIV